ncbi:hypothetical protein ACFO25_09335 [Paenactinomyces guangxiensis]|uniref:Uncharacterized protein n=1 Tax=Paenactinomyces guangxiensis TaxID=1490290 RepID=A0A7W2A749_9BACL|nr:hypothetical protein [Paenactinomyces guangxiensis]MBA4492752.1 hypothetical protein [Paenactinomyces guangxiensis]MBH8590399.1 hypothetical protein [Paenactinomyces guangxiensis]
MPFEKQPPFGEGFELHPNPSAPNPDLRKGKKEDRVPRMRNSTIGGEPIREEGGQATPME